MINHNDYIKIEMFNQIPKTSIIILLSIVLFALVTFLISFYLTSDSNRGDWLPGLLLNLGTELFGAVIIYFLIDLVIGIREKTKKKFEDRKASQTRSITNLSKAQTPEEKQLILDEMHKLGLLRGANFRSRNLDDLFLREMDLQEANLQWTSLKGADLSGAQLQGADLSNADLTECTSNGVRLDRSIIFKTKFIDSYLVEADFTGAKIQEADFSGADLTKSKFLRAEIDKVISNQKTKLPNGQFQTSEKELENYTSSTLFSFLDE